MSRNSESDGMGYSMMIGDWDWDVDVRLEM